MKQNIISPLLLVCNIKSITFSLLALVLLCTSNEIFGQSNSRIDSLKTAFENETNDSLKVLSEINLAKGIHRMQHDLESEYFHAKEAVDRALRINDTVLYARALDNLGLLYRYHQRYDQALSLHTRAFELIKDKDVDPIFKMIMGNNAGVAGRYNHKNDTAFLYYMQALKIAEDVDNLKNIAISTNGIGNTLSNIPGRENEALPYFERSLKAQQEIGNDLGVAMNYLSISDYYIVKGDFETANEYLKKLLKLNQDRNDEFGIAITYEYMGISKLKEGEDLDKAVTYFQTSADGYKSLKNIHRQAEILTHLGNTYLKKGELNRAEDYYKESLQLSKGLNALAMISTNVLKLSEVSEQKGDYKSALSNFKLSQVYKDSININEQNVKIEALTQEYNLEKKESHIQFLEKDKALQQVLLNTQKDELKRRQIITILLAIALGAILIIFFMQYRNYKIRKTANERLNQAEKEKMVTIYERNLAQAEILVTRLQINPHFIFNSLNAITYLIQSEQNCKAIEYLGIFSHYTRMVLETSKQQVISLQEELELAENYLKLEENRFSNDFKYVISGIENPDLEDVLIPPLLIQPFLENAIWHGLLASPRKKKLLSIHIEIDENQTQIIIDDNGAGRDNKNKINTIKSHNSMGMGIIKERIELYNKTNEGKINYKIIDKKDDEGKPLGTRIILELYNTMDYFRNHPSKMSVSHA